MMTVGYEFEPVADVLTCRVCVDVAVSSVCDRYDGERIGAVRVSGIFRDRATSFN